MGLPKFSMVPFLLSVVTIWAAILWVASKKVLLLIEVAANVPQHLTNYTQRYMYMYIHAQP